MWALQLIVGLAVLAIGAEVLIRNAVKLALAARISHLVVGMTVVAFGTSAPELVVSVQSALAGEPDIALGNVVGSSTFNILFILGLAALITPLTIDVELIRVDVPLMIGMSLLLWIFAANGRIGRLEGLLLVGGLMSFTGWTIVASWRNHSTQFDQELPAEPVQATAGKLLLWLVLIVAGVVLLVVGAQQFTTAAVAIARRLGVSELVIGLTIVSAGTALPEVATSVMAAGKGERDIAVGNLVGSNIFNILCVLGVTATVTPAGIPVASAALQLDIPVMVAVCVACLPIFFTRHRVDRWEGALLLAYYAAYVTALLLIATDSVLLEMYSLAMLGVVIPLTVVTLAISTFLAWQRQTRSRPSR